MSLSLATLENGAILTEALHQLSRTISCDSFNAMGVGHYENFPVASWLMPARLRPAVRAIYRFARTADDLADEGDAAPAERLSALAALRAQLRAIEIGEASNWADLAAAIREHQLQLALFYDLLSAFSQDALTVRYDSFETLIDYCRRSANRSAVCCCSSFAAAKRSCCNSRTQFAPACSWLIFGRTSRSIGERAACTCRSAI